MSDPPPLRIDHRLTLFLGEGAHLRLWQNVQHGFGGTAQACSRLVTGEVVFAVQALLALLTAPLRPQADAHRPKHAILFYPETPQVTLPGLPIPPDQLS